MMDQKPEYNWEPCSTGEINNMISSVRKMKQRKKTLRTITTVASIATVLLVCSLPFIGQETQAKPTGHNIGGIFCSEVITHAEQYQNGTISEEIKAKIKVHLAACHMCQEEYNQLSFELNTLTTNSELLVFMGKLETHTQH